jgi:UDP-3-O-[3-hydroxymyristoyl] glucosamine N-acyltransferase
VQARLADIVAALGGELRGDPELTIHRIAPLEHAGPDAISFLAHLRLLPQLAGSRAGCVIVRPEHETAACARGAAILAPDPYLYFARLTQWWAARLRARPPSGVHPSAVIEPGAVLHPQASVGALAYVGAGARLGAGVVVSAQAFVGEGAELGEHTWLGPRVVFERGCRIGARGVVQPGAVIGGDGFGFAPDAGQWVKIEQLGAVRIGDDVEIGANTCIDRGALDDTVIDDGVKLDNLIQIGHNCHIGAHTAMAGCTGVAGSTRIGRHCTAGGSAMILGHLEIADHVHISAATVVSRSIRQPGQYSGFFPIDDNATWEKNAATLRQLHLLRDRIRALEKKT